MKRVKQYPAIIYLEPRQEITRTKVLTKSTDEGNVEFEYPCAAKAKIGSERGTEHHFEKEDVTVEGYGVGQEGGWVFHRRPTREIPLQLPTFTMYVIAPASERLQGSIRAEIDILEPGRVRTAIKSLFARTPKPKIGHEFDVE
jgi:hypothetical protein